MKKIIMLIAFVMTVDTSFAQVDALSSIGWRKGVLTSYCEEINFMIDNGKQWILPWNATKEVVKYALMRDGYPFEETDSTINWKYQSIFKYEIQFTEDSQIKNAGTIIILKPVNGIPIAESIKKILESIYGEKGNNYKPEGASKSSTSYTWLNKKCDKTVITMLTKIFLDKDTKTIVDDDEYIITQYSSRLK
jgi:hypothetical protein